MTNTKLAYLAGLVDGEGWITTARNSKHGNIVVRLGIANTDWRVMCWLKENFGGRIDKKKKVVSYHRDSWMWGAGCKDVTRILKAILPYMIIKGEQAKLGLELRARIENYWKRGRNATASEKALDYACRDELCEKIRFLNRHEGSAATTKSVSTDNGDVIVWTASDAKGAEVGGNDRPDQQIH